VVVNHRNLARVTAPAAPSNPNRKGKGKKKKKKGLSLGELMASGDGDESEDFDAPSPSPGPGGTKLTQYMFSSPHHSAAQRLYYLLATRPAPTQSAGEQQQPGGGRSPVAPGGDAAAVEGGCHALVFVETTAVAQELAGELKALGLVAFALHDRTPKAQVSMRCTLQTSELSKSIIIDVKGRTHCCLDTDTHLCSLALYDMVNCCNDPAYHAATNRHRNTSSAS